MPAPVEAAMNEQQIINYRFMQKALKLFLNMGIDSSIMNPQYVPDEGPFVLVANHRSDQDPFLILSSVRRPINFLAASYLWNIPGSRQLMQMLGGIPVSKHRSDIKRAFDKAVACLKAGQGVGVFPEGWDYISKNLFDWSVGDFQTGFARIALQTGAPVVPVAMQGLDERRGKQPFAPFMRRIMDYPIELQYVDERCEYKKLNINVGKPIPCPKGADPNDHDAVNAFTKQVNDAVRALYEELPRVPGFAHIVPHPAGPSEKDIEAEIEEYETRDAEME